MTFRSKLQAAWDAFQYGLRGGLVLDALWDLRMWRRRRQLTGCLKELAASVQAERNTPWAMLDREDAEVLGREYCRRLGIDFASVTQIRPIITPVDTYKGHRAPGTLSG